MKTKWNKLSDFAESSKGLHGSNFPKESFKRIGTAALREISDELSATGLVSNCDIKFNPAGPAVSGDFSLRGDFNVGGSFDLFFGMNNYAGLEVCYRATKNKKDYSGDRNRWMTFDTENEQVIANILTLQPREKEQAAAQL